MKTRFVLGIMSGTSIDGVDYALCEISPGAIRLRHRWFIGFPKALQAILQSAARGDLKSHALGQAHHDLGRFYALHAKKSPPHLRPGLVGLHGQTIFHHPSPDHPSTFQLGEPAYLAEALRVPVINNFRAADMAAGGQGAPLATQFHQLVFAQAGRHVCVNNLGGISNVTSLAGRNVLAFDTGPANILIDLAMRRLSHGRLHLDKGGLWSARGRPSEKHLVRWLKHDYFAQPPPKSAGRELFGEPFFTVAMRQMRSLSPFDKVATLTELTARSLALNYRLHLPSSPRRIILAGGGASNPSLVRAITRQFPRDVEILTSAALGWPVESIEPAAFALLAHRRMTRSPGNLPKTTGAQRATLLGQISEY